MIETLKFINIKTHTSDQADKDISKYEYQKTMDSLYKTLNKYKPLGFDSARVAIDRGNRDQDLKENGLQNMNHTHIIVPYNEIISHTDKENIKKITIALLNDNLSNPISEAQIFLFKDKLQKAYDLYNKIISQYKYDNPFLDRDGEIVSSKKQIKADINSMSKIGNDIRAQTGTDLRVLSTVINAAIRNISRRGL